MDLEEWYDGNVAAFHEELRQLLHDSYNKEVGHHVLITDELAQMHETLLRLGRLGERLVVDFSDSRNCDRLHGCYADHHARLLYLHVAEEEDDGQDVWLKAMPSRMIIGVNAAEPAADFVMLAVPASEGAGYKCYASASEPRIGNNCIYTVQGCLLAVHPKGSLYTDQRRLDELFAASRRHFE